MATERHLAAKQAWWIACLSSAGGILVFAIATGQMGNFGAVLWSEEAAGWASAFGTLVAAGIALKLGLNAELRSEDDQLRRQRAAAKVLLRSFVPAVMNVRGVLSLYRAGPAMDIWLSHEARADRSRELILDIPELLPENLGQLLVELDDDSATWVGLASQAQTNARRRLARTTGASLLFVALDTARKMEPSVVSAATRLHQLAYGAEVDVPWETDTDV